MGEPLKCNQIRAHTNQRGEVNYYLVLANGAKLGNGKGKPATPQHIIWFRATHPDDAMYLLHDGVNKAKWDLTEDPVVVENMNHMRTALLNASIIAKQATLEPHRQEIIEMFDPANPMRDKVAAIKWYREKSGESLKESKLYVEKVMDEEGIHPRNLK